MEDIGVSGMNNHPSISRTDIEYLTNHLNITVTAERTNQIQAEIADGLDGYTSLEIDAAAEAPQIDRQPPSVSFDPSTKEDQYNAFISQFELGGSDGSLSNLDVAIKDNIAVAGIPMTGGSDVFIDATPESDATVVERLLNAGARILGKANMDELAYGPTGETSAFGAAENPAAPGRVTGGSSSGSAAAVASEVVDASLGTDTGGSVRIPASFCGVVGFKPTWGAISRFGVIELAYTLDHVGSLTRDIHTAARVLDTIVGPDPRDPSTIGAGAVAADSFIDCVESPPNIASFTLGIPKEFFGSHVEDDVETMIRDRIGAMADAGATVREVSVPLVKKAVSIWNAIVNIELSTFIESSGTPMFRRGPIDVAWQRDATAGIADESREFGSVVQRKAVEGKYLVQEHDAKHYVAARNKCHTLSNQFTATFSECDFLVTPTMATRAPEIGLWSPHSYSSANGDTTPPLAINTRPADLAGIPAVTVPIGADGGPPIGIQFIGDENEDVNVLAAGAAFEQFR